MALDGRVTTTVFDFSDTEDGLSSVIGLRVLPSGPLFPFDDFRIENKIKRILIIGAEPGCDIVLDDEGVSGLHCLIERHNHLLLVHDCESKNGTRVNGVLVKVGELAPRALLSVGHTTMLAYGPESTEERVVIRASSLDEFLVHAVEAHGSVRGAAEAIGIPYSTLRGWLKRRITCNPLLSKLSSK